MLFYTLKIFPNNTFQIKESASEIPPPSLVSLIEKIHHIIQHRMQCVYAPSAFSSLLSKQELQNTINLCLELLNLSIQQHRTAQQAPLTTDVVMSCQNLLNKMKGIINSSFFYSQFQLQSPPLIPSPVLSAMKSEKETSSFFDEESYSAICKIIGEKKLAIIDNAISSIASRTSQTTESTPSSSTTVVTTGTASSSSSRFSTFTFTQTLRSPGNIFVHFKTQEYSENILFMYNSYLRASKHCFAPSAASILNPSIPLTIQSLPLALQYLMPIELQKISNTKPSSDTPAYYWTIAMACHYTLQCLETILTKINPEDRLLVNMNHHKSHTEHLLNVIDECKKISFENHHYLITLPGSSHTNPLLASTTKFYIHPNLSQKADLNLPGSSQISLSKDTLAGTSISFPTRKRTFSPFSQQPSSKKAHLSLEDANLNSSDEEDPLLGREPLSQIESSLIQPRKSATSHSSSMSIQTPIAIAQAASVSGSLILTPLEIYKSTPQSLATRFLWIDEDSDTITTLLVRMLRKTQEAHKEIYLITAVQTALLRNSLNSHCKYLTNSFTSCMNQKDPPDINIITNPQFKIVSSLTEEQDLFFILLFLAKVAYARVIQSFIPSNNYQRILFEEMKASLEAKCKNILFPHSHNDQ